MSNSLSRRQALDHGVDRLSEWGGCFVDNPDALTLYLDGLDHFESFSDIQKHQYHFIMAKVLMILEAIRCGCIARQSGNLQR